MSDRATAKAIKLRYDFREPKPGVEGYKITIEANPTAINPKECGSSDHSTITVTVTNPDDSPAPNVDVALSAEAVQNSGGHNHSSGRSSGTFSSSSGKTDSEGKFQSTYTASKFGGQEKVKATVGTAEKTVTLDISVSGLSGFSGGTGCYLCGATSTHPSNHYCTSVTNSKIQQLASTYETEFSENLAINDMSLVQGGLFDINADWNTPHSEHRLGRNADMYPTGTPTDEKWKFIRTGIVALGCTYFDEGNHIHFRQ